VNQKIWGGGRYKKGFQCKETLPAKICDPRADSGCLEETVKAAMKLN
jgi:hypothetical protein